MSGEGWQADRAGSMTLSPRLQRAYLRIHTSLTSRTTWYTPGLPSMGFSDHILRLSFCCTVSPAPLQVTGFTGTALALGHLRRERCGIGTEGGLAVASQQCQFVCTNSPLT